MTSSTSAAFPKQVQVLLCGVRVHSLAQSGRILVLTKVVEAPFFTRPRPSWPEPVPRLSPHFNFVNSLPQCFPEHPRASRSPHTPYCFLCPAIDYATPFGMLYSPCLGITTFRDPSAHIMASAPPLGRLRSPSLAPCCLAQALSLCLHDVLSLPVYVPASHPSTVSS